MAAPVPRGPLAVRWLEWEVAEPRAGVLLTAVVEVENAGLATWRPGRGEGVHLSYHWLDERGNAIVWDGLRTPLPRPVSPGERLRAALEIRAPIPPGRYRLAVDLLDEGRTWFADVGNAPLELEVAVLPRIGRALAVRGGDRAALAAQEEPLVPEERAEAVAFLSERCAPGPGWSRLVLDAHQEGYAVVAGSIDARGPLGRRPRELSPWAPGGGRVPGFAQPLLCPSVVRGVQVEWIDPVAGLPAARPPAGDEPWIYDGRIELRVRRRGRRGVSRV